MNFLLDSGSKSEYQKWRSVVSGVTTNPSIVLRDGCTNIEGLKELCELVHPDKVSIEISFTDIDAEKMARQYSDMIPNVVIKVPLLHPLGGNNLDIISSLEADNIPVNCTALFNLSQVIMGAKSGASYLSVFAGRIDDEGGEWIDVVNDCSRWVLNEGLSCKLIVGSLRTVGQVLDCANMEFSPDYVTVPPSILEKMCSHHYSLETVRQFEEAAAKAENDQGIKRSRM